MKRILAGLILALLIAGPAAADEYRAEKFDSRIDVLPGGDLRVTETIVFRFEEGSFTKVFRVIPTRRTDGVDFVRASMDGVDVVPGSGARRVEIRRRDGLRVEWRFPSTAGTTHTFVLTYVARGVVRQESTADLVAWRALPSEHAYRIDRSTIDVFLPDDAVAPPSTRVRRVTALHDEHGPRHARFVASDIARNGWVELSVALPRGAVLTAPPAWQQTRERYDSYRTPALVAAGVIVFATVVFLFGNRQSYESPPPAAAAPTVFGEPPDQLPPALAGALASNGTPKSPHAFATLFALADRGVVSVEEERGMWGTRAFSLTRRHGTEALAPHERALLDTVFGAAHDHAVTLSKAHSRVTMKFKAFREAVREELRSAGFIDAGREQVRRNYHATGVGLLLLAAVSIVPVAFMFDRYGPWMFMIPAAVVVSALATMITGSAHTALSNEGVRRAEAWRAYRKFLRDLPGEGVRHTPHQGMQSPARLLPFAVALGIGAAWAKLFKDRAAELPAWFRAASAADAHRAFVAFVGVSGAHAGHGGSAGGGGGAAGGGASGAG